MGWSHDANADSISGRANTKWVLVGTFDIDVAGLARVNPHVCGPLLRTDIFDMNDGWDFPAGCWPLTQH